MKKLLYITTILLIVGCASKKTGYYIKTAVSPDSNIKIAIINENASARLKL